MYPTPPVKIDKSSEIIDFDEEDNKTLPSKNGNVSIMDQLDSE